MSQSAVRVGAGEGLPPSRGRRFLDQRSAELGPALSGFFIIVMIVATGSALALLGWPSHSGTYFSWDLGHPTAAALIGGLYLASVVVFADAARRPRHQTRALTIGVVGLALPTLAFTAANDHVFDWTRPQAVAWVILFCSAPISIGLDLRRPTRSEPGPRMSAAARVLATVISLAGAGLAVGVWVGPFRARLADSSPIPLAGLTADYVGAWAAFVAVAAAVAAVQGRPGDARTLGVLLGSVSLGAAIAAARTAGDLRANTALYLVGLLATTALALILIRQAGPSGNRPAQPSIPERNTQP